MVILKVIFWLVVIAAFVWFGHQLDKLSKIPFDDGGNAQDREA